MLLSNALKRCNFLVPLASSLLGSDPPQADQREAGGFREAEEHVHLFGRARRGQRGAAHRSNVSVRTMTSHFYSDPQRQSRTTEMKIKEEFEELRRYLKTEEANMLAALKREESQKVHLIQTITETRRDALSLSDSVKKMEELASDASFLTVSVRLEEVASP